MRCLFGLVGERFMRRLFLTACKVPPHLGPVRSVATGGGRLSQVISIGKANKAVNIKTKLEEY
jgi:hypothetical protein